MSKMIDKAKPVLGLAAADINTAKTGGYISLENHRQALAILTTATLTAAKKATLEILQAKDSAGASSKTLKTVEVVSTGTGVVVAANVQAEELSPGFSHIAVKASTDLGTTLSASATVLLGEGRYGA